MTPTVDEVPEWWKKAVKIWEEDDALTPDAEGPNQAWRRLFGIEQKEETPLESVDMGDAVMTLYENNRVACSSYRGNNEIRILPKDCCTCGHPAEVKYDGKYDYYTACNNYFCGDRIFGHGLSAQASVEHWNRTIENRSRVRDAK